MRGALLILGLCAACATTVRDLEPGRAADPSQALLAGQVAFDGLHLRRQPDGEGFQVRPGHETFLVAVPPGSYVVTGFGPYEPTHDRLSFEARAGEALYIGSFLRTRDDRGDLMVLVRDEIVRAQADLERRYGENTPLLKRSLVRSSMGPADGELVVAVSRHRPNVHWYFGFSYPFYYGYYYDHYYGYYYDHYYGHRHYRSRRRR